LKRVREFHYTITGYDKAPSAVQKAKTIVKTQQNTSKSKKETFDTEKRPKEATHGFPYYDERLDIHMEEFYKNIGDTLKKNYQERILGLLQEI
jgi:putative N6-adenine-specific DNA methylase